MHVHGATRGEGARCTRRWLCAPCISLSLSPFLSLCLTTSLSFLLSFSLRSCHGEKWPERVRLPWSASASLSLLWSLLSGFLYFPLSLSFPSLSFSRFVSLYCFTTLSPILVFVLLNYVSYFYTVLLTIRISCQNTINFFLLSFFFLSFRVFDLNIGTQFVVYIYCIFLFTFQETVFSSEYNEFSLFLSICFSFWPSCIQKRTRPHERPNEYISVLRLCRTTDRIGCPHCICACTSY